MCRAGGTDAIFSPPYHPYTEALLSAVPIADTSVEKRVVLEGGFLGHQPAAGLPLSNALPA